ncbi:DMT family transporter [Limosilactobacillus fastidiosus]|uniref:DMT family transporter n=1 Tax=Limosilactobacillus fastidiosus TaxID=2759855 RepID=A0A7W3YCA4_9LACO|nr:DMT family transporter [Limosilactobacillus fastidiosus]MBB1085876.1 DMT family transporter [Limosilactobacillus fastidiosus]MCD7085787.1 DMT family transporter [Limosilactobacillus fastidiosus]MCD7113864.1 DMT family transporter [Limosilactobacillus fastidiosus]MCD7115696.1 DMT family transporter [Limosilactobacillus fastidiosus]
MKFSKSTANLLLVFVTVLWGSTYIFNKMVVNARMQSGTINAVRGAMCVIGGIILFHRQLRQANRFDIKIGLIVGVVNFCGYYLRTLGLRYTTPAKSSFITVTYVILTPLVLWLFWHERPKFKIIFAIPLSLTGMAILTGITTSNWHLQPGDLITFLSAFFWAFQIIIFGKYASRASSPWIIITLIGAVQVICGTPLALTMERSSLAHVNWLQALLPLLIVAVVITFAARGIQIRAQKYTDATSASLILMSESFFATVISVLLGYDQLSPRLVLGGILIIMANVIMQLDFQNTRLKTEN